MRAARRSPARRRSRHPVPCQIDDDQPGCTGQGVESPVAVALQLVHPARGRGCNRIRRWSLVFRCRPVGRGLRRRIGRGTARRGSRPGRRRRPGGPGGAPEPRVHPTATTTRASSAARVAADLLITLIARLGLGNHGAPDRLGRVGQRMGRAPPEHLDGSADVGEDPVRRRPAQGRASRISPLNPAASASSSTAVRAGIARPLPQLITAVGRAGASAAATTACRDPGVEEVPARGQRAHGDEVGPGGHGVTQPAAARPSRFSSRNPGPIGLNTRSVTASARPAALASSSSRVAADGSGRSRRPGPPDRPRRPRPCGTGPYSPADPNRMKRIAGSTSAMASISWPVPAC